MGRVQGQLPCSLTHVKMQLNAARFAYCPFLWSFTNEPCTIMVAKNEWKIPDFQNSISSDEHEYCWLVIWRRETEVKCVNFSLLLIQPDVATPQQFEECSPSTEIIFQTLRVVSGGKISVCVCVGPCREVLPWQRAGGRMSAAAHMDVGQQKMFYLPTTSCQAAHKSCFFCHGWQAKPWPLPLSQPLL